MIDRTTVARIDLNNYSHNIAQILSLISSDTRLMAVVKANAYGHGIEKIAAAAIASGASYLGVASLGELRQIRTAGIESPVLLLGYIDIESVDEAVRLDGSVTVFDLAGIEATQAAGKRQSKTVNVHIKVDTGMHRAGCDPKEAPALARAVEHASFLELEGFFTHFAESEATDGAFTRKQLGVFSECIESLKAEGTAPPLIHCANSAALLAFPEAHFTMVRAGIVTYGLNPFALDHPRYDHVAKNFMPVLSLVTQVSFVRHIETGETVGYNRRWKAERRTTLALLPVGYGDGYRRTPHNAGTVLINGQQAPIVGGIAMDQMVIDITDTSEEVSAGDEVVLLGQQGSSSISADDLASAYQTINYEVVTALTDRIVRQY